MGRMNHIALVAVVLLGQFLGSLGLFAAERPAWKAVWMKSLTAEQRRDVYELRKQFLAAGRDLDRCETVVKDGVSRGPHAAMGLLLEINPQLYVQLKEYGAGFYQEAATLSRQTLGQNLNETAGQEIALLRRNVLALRRQELNALQVRQVNQALLRLQEIFAVDRAKVVARSPSLQNDRARLQRFGKRWEACTLVLYNAIPNHPNKVPQAPKFDQYLSGEEEIMVGMAAPMYKRTAQVNLRNFQVVGKIDAADPEPGRFVLAVNLMRNLLGLDPLVIDATLCQGAKVSAQEMLFTQKLNIRVPATSRTIYGLGYFAAFDGHFLSRALFARAKTIGYGMADFTHVGAARAGPCFVILWK